MVETVIPNKTMDCRGDSCSLMLAKIKKGMDEMGEGDVLEVISTDPCAEYDLPDWSQKTGKEIISADHVTIYHIRKLH